MRIVIGRSFKYGCFTCAVAYILALLPAFVLFSTLFRGSYESVVDARGMLGFLTLGLSDFSCCDKFYYLTVLVPWITSSLVLALLHYHIGGRYGMRLILSGLSVFLYYFTMWLGLIISGIFLGWGDIAYDLIWLWPIGGFLTGVAASAIVEKVFRPESVRG